MINRREFLVESLVAGAGLSLLPALVADAQSDPLIFDLHAHPGTFFATRAGRIGISIWVG